MRVNFEMHWPFAMASTVEHLRQENTLLKSALHEANKELAKHRRLLAGIREGRVDIVTQIDRIAKEEGARARASSTS